jgi:hypothetical protein
MVGFCLISSGNASRFFLNAKAPRRKDAKETEICLAQSTHGNGTISHPQSLPMNRGESFEHAKHGRGKPVWKPATQQVWKPALRKR